jgi:hypothetical protein
MRLTVFRKRNQSSLRNIRDKKIPMYSRSRLFVLMAADILGLLGAVLATNPTNAKDLETVRAAISERERLPDPYQLTVKRISETEGEKSKPGTKYVIKWRPDAKTVIKTDDEERVVVLACNDKYSFKTTISLLGTPFMLNDFIVGKGKEAMIEPWDVQRKLLRSDLFLLGTISLRALVDDPSAAVEQDTNGGIKMTVKPSQATSGLPSLVECVFDPSKNYLVTSAHVETVDEDTRWEAVEVEQIAPNYFMSRVERFTTLNLAKNKTIVSTDTKVYSMDVPSMDEFRMRAYRIPEPEDEEVKSAPIPYFYIFLAVVVVIVFLIALLQYYLRKPTSQT